MYNKNIFQTHSQIYFDSHIAIKSLSANHIMRCNFRDKSYIFNKICQHRHCTHCEQHQCTSYIIAVLQLKRQLQRCVYCLHFAIIVNISHSPYLSLNQLTFTICIQPVRSDLTQIGKGLWQNALVLKIQCAFGIRHNKYPNKKPPTKLADCGITKI